MKEFETLESAVLQKIEKELTGLQKLFNENGIDHDSPEIEVLDSSPENYESEFRVSFYYNSKFLDIIECHIFRKGKPIANLEEFDSWIEDAFQDLSDEIKKIVTERDE